MNAIRARAAAAALGLSLIVLASAGCSNSGSGPEGDALNDSIKASRYQSVILTNDRVYFGHLRALGDGWYQLRNAYFIRQQTDDKTKTATQKVTPVAEELQQPDSTIMINRDNIVQVENLAADSRVALAIKGLAR